MKVYKSPDPTVYFSSSFSLFMAGGITNCPDWQQEMTEKLETLDAIAYNPRREHFDVADTNIAAEQIEWEYSRLRIVDGVLFWFCKETIQPIVLFELGGALERSQKLFIGMDPEYPRKMDVITQVALIRPTPIVYSLDELAYRILHR